MNKPKQRFAGGAILAMLSGTVQAEYGLNMRQGVTETSQQVYDLHMLILWICVAIGVVVFGAMIYSMINHRKSRGAVASQFHESMAVELIWTVLPFIILIAMAIPATKVLIAMDDSSEADLSIKVTAYQWKWRYEYLDEGIDFFSRLDADSNAIRQVGSDLDPNDKEAYLLDVDNRLVIPANKKVRFLLTASDVIHSWWVPDFGWKKDAVPGFVNEAWTKVAEPGVYRGQCAELCGRDHGFMPIVVEVLSESDYAAWVAQQKGEPVVATKVALAEPAAEASSVVEKAEQAVEIVKEAVAETAAAVTEAASEVVADAKAAVAEVTAPTIDGKTVYTSNCAACHQADGKGIPGLFPSIAGSAVATGPAEDHIKVVLNGRVNTAMQAFRDQLSDEELAAVITYQRNAFGNDMGDTVSASDIAALR